VTLSTANPTTVSLTRQTSRAGTDDRAFHRSPTNPTINQDVTFNGTASTVSTHVCVGFRDG